MRATTPFQSSSLWLRRFAWLILIWIASVGTLGLLAFALRGLMGLAGMHA